MHHPHATCSTLACARLPPEGVKTLYGLGEPAEVKRPPRRAKSGRQSPHIMRGTSRTASGCLQAHAGTAAELQCKATAGLIPARAGAMSHLIANSESAFRTPQAALEVGHHVGRLLRCSCGTRRDDERSVQAHHVSQGACGDTPAMKPQKHQDDRVVSLPATREAGK